MRFFNTFLLIIMLGVTTLPSFAQDNAKDMEELVEGTKNDLLVVIAGGLAGAVLGLSTLSFVEEPKEHTRNIIVGASLGIIAGVGYVAYSQANRSREMMYGAPSQTKLDGKNFETTHRVSWHYHEVNDNSHFIVTPNQLTYSFQY